MKKRWSVNDYHRGGKDVRNKAKTYLVFIAFLIYCLTEQSPPTWTYKGALRRYMEAYPNTELVSCSDEGTGENSRFISCVLEVVQVKKGKEVSRKQMKILCPSGFLTSVGFGECVVPTNKSK